MALVLEVAFVVEDAEGEGSGLGLHDALGLEQGFDWLEEGGPYLKPLHYPTDFG